jgi:DNA-binding ferritin-like protein
MNLTPINVYINSNLEQKNNSVKEFSLYLCDILNSIKLLHWYSYEYNFHKILDETYESFDNLFDKLIEEIIGITKNVNNFSLEFPKRDVKKVLDSDCLEEQIKELSGVLESLENTIKNSNMNTFVESNSFNGINNTIEEILSASNKCKYLINMIK